jgi:heme/copper-type cytochrome/quinol oxidase subunit 3
MWVFLGSECLLFGGLISTYLLYKTASRAAHRPRRRLRHPVHLGELVRAADELAHHGAGRVGHRPGRPPAHPHLAATTALLGAVFIAGQVYEFTAFYREGLGFTTNIFGSAFYTLTGFHGVHVTVGIIMLMSLFVMSLRGRLCPERAETVEIVGLYWHFVDIVWILIFTVVYLIPSSTMGHPGRQPEGDGHRDEDDDLDHLEAQDHGDLGATQPGTPERRGAEAFEHAVLALEAGGDAER